MDRDSRSLRAWLGLGLLAGALIISLGALSWTASGESPFQVGTIQIGTFNLEFFTDLDPSTGAWCESHNHRTMEEIRALASFIDSLDIEVLALQEVEDSQAMDLLLSFMPPGKYAYVILPQTSPETCQRVAVLYQPQEVSIEYRGEIPLSLGHFGLRDGLVVTGKVLPDGFDFTMVVVHLKAYFDHDSRRLREQQLKVLGDWAKEYIENPENDPDLVLAGDFNERLLTNRRAFSLLDQGVGMWLITQDVPDKRCTPPGRYWSDPIDHIVISPDAAKEYEGTAVLDNFFTNSTLHYRTSYSDHCVLWGDFNTADLDPTASPDPP